MKGVRLEKPGLLRFHADLPEPEVFDSGVRVRVRGIGICGTDLHAFAGKQPFFSYPRILGHELCVEVLPSETECGELKPGDLCAVEPYLHDPETPASRMGRTNCCEHLQVYGVHTDGGMVERMCIPASKLHRSSVLGVEALALVEPLCIGEHAAVRAEVGPDSTVLVTGAGPIGIAALQACLRRGAKVAVSDLRPGQLDFCRDAFEVESLLPSESDDPERRLRDAFGGELPSVVFDATGDASSMSRCLYAVAHGGKVVFLGIHNGPVPVDDPTLHRKELTLLASRNATAADFQSVLQALETGKLDAESWITHRYSLQSIAGSFASCLQAPDRIKAFVTVDG